MQWNEHSVFRDIIISYLSMRQKLKIERSIHNFQKYTSLTNSPLFSKNGKLNDAFNFQQYTLSVKEFEFWDQNSSFPSSVNLMMHWIPFSTVHISFKFWDQNSIFPCSVKQMKMHSIFNSTFTVIGYKIEFGI